MFDKPRFYQEGSNRVSIWASKVPYAEIPESYFEENYGEDDELFNQFSADFGFGYYNHDFVERAGDYGETTIEKLKFASYGESFYEVASAACKMLEVDFFFLMYDFTYEPSKTHIDESKYLKFIGSFPYNKSI